MAMVDSEAKAGTECVDQLDGQHIKDQTQWVNFSNCHWSYCHHHGWTKCYKCEQQDEEWSEQSEVKCNESNNEPQTYSEPLQKKARCQERTITEDIFDLIGSLDDQRLTAASRIVKAAIQYRRGEAQRRRTFGYTL